MERERPGPTTQPVDPSSGGPDSGADLLDSEVGRSDAVVELLGPAYPTMATFVDLLVEQGVLRGLIGPREVPRLWSRHILNCAAVAPYLPATGTVIDIGSGAGLPGIVLAAMRPDLHVVLLEPMERRVAWLGEVVAHLDLSSTEVVRARAEDVRGELVAEAVTARAVAPLRKLVPWSMPMLAPGGRLLAMKGARAADELRDSAAVIRRHGGVHAEVLLARSVPAVEPTTLVRVLRSEGSPGRH